MALKRKRGIRLDDDSLTIRLPTRIVVTHVKCVEIADFDETENRLRVRLAGGEWLMIRKPDPSVVRDLFAALGHTTDEFEPEAKRPRIEQRLDSTNRCSPE